MQELVDILQTMDWSSLWISLETGVVATIITFLLGIFAAWGVMRLRSPWRELVDGVLTMPMVLPPTVAGFILLLVFSRRRPVGLLLWEGLHIKVVQSWLGCVLAVAVIAFPLMYRSAKAAFELVDVDLIHVARTLGMSEREILLRVVLPAAGSGIAGGTLLSFARALGEYGATSMLAGNIPGKTATISQQIALVIQDQDFATAGVWVVLVLVVGLAATVLFNLLMARRRDRDGRGGGWRS